MQTNKSEQFEKDGKTTNLQNATQQNKPHWHLCDEFFSRL